MKKILAFSFIILSFVNKTWSQEEDLIDPNHKKYEELVSIIQQAYDNEDYKTIINTLGRIHDGHPVYNEVFYPLASAYFATDEIDLAIDLLLTRIDQPNKPYYVLSNTMYVNALMKLGDFINARKICDKMLKEDPNLYVFDYLKGMSYFSQTDYKNATIYFQKSLIQNPFYNPSHAMLGNLYLIQGKITEAYIALFMSLNFDDNSESESLKLLNELAEVSEEILTIAKEREIPENYVYKVADERLLSKKGLEQADKVNPIFNHAIVKQLSFILDSLYYDPNSTNFVNQYYLPLMLEMHETKFEAFCTYILKENNHNHYLKNKHLLTNQHESNEAKKHVVFYYNQLLGTKVINLARRYQIVPKAMYSPSEQIFVYGNSSMNDDLTISLNGDNYRMYNNQFILFQEGAIRGSRKEGTWRSYNMKYGSLERIEKYLNNKVIESVTYTPSGSYTTSILKESNVVAEVNKYNEGNVLISNNKFYDIINSNLTIFWPTGEYKGMLQIRNGTVFDKNIKFVYANKKTYIQASFKNGKQYGKEHTYFKNGNLKTVKYYNNEQSYNLETYFPNGQLNQERKFKNPNVWTGIVNSYNYNGTLFSSYEQKEDKLHGSYKYYDSKTSKVISEYIYDNGVLKKYTIFDEKGNIEASEVGTTLTSMKFKKGFHFPSTTIQLNQFGSMIGSFDIYYENGNVLESVNYMAGKKEGIQSKYYSDGGKKVETSFVNGMKNGIETSYYPNGNIQSKINYLDDEAFGLNEGFYLDGKMKHSYFELDGVLNGTALNYYPNGNIKEKCYYIKGNLLSLEIYDINGRKMDAVTHETPNGKFELKYRNGNLKIAHELQNNTYVNGMSLYYSNGQLREREQYEDKYSDFGTWQLFYPNGSLKAKYKIAYQSPLDTAFFYLVDGSINRCLIKNPKNGFATNIVLAGGKIINQSTLSYENTIGYEDYFVDGRKIATFNYINYPILHEYITYNQNATPVDTIRISNDDMKIVISNNGKVQFEADLNKMIFTGLIKTYYDNGSEYSTFKLKNGIDKDNILVKNEKGQIILKEQYNLEGSTSLLEYYNQDGQLMQSESYLNEVFFGPFKSFDKSTNQYFEFDVD